ADARARHDGPPGLLSPLPDGTGAQTRAAPPWDTLRDAFCMQSTPPERSHHAHARLPPHRSPFPPGSRAEPGAGAHPAGPGPTDHRSSGPRVRPARAGDPRRYAPDLPDATPGRDLSGIGNRRLGGGPVQHPEPRRPRPDVRDRALRLAVAEHGRPARAGYRGPRPSRPRRTASRRPAL